MKRVSLETVFKVWAATVFGIAAIGVIVAIVNLAIGNYHSISI